MITLTKNWKKIISEETKFYLRTYFTNTFTVFSFFIILTTFLKISQPIADFRTILWSEQLWWVFFVPMIYQTLYEWLTTNRIMNDKLKQISVRGLLVSIILNLRFGIFIVDYALFASSMLLIIPEDFHEARGINYDKFIPIFWLVSITFTVLFLARQRYKKQLVKNGDIKEITKKELNIDVKITLIWMGFILSLISFVIIHN